MRDYIEIFVPKNGSRRNPTTYPTPAAVPPTSAISRRREFMADSGSVQITRQPAGLISALEKIASDHEPLEAANKATAHLYIENPFKDKTKSAVSWFSALFNTHPPVEERIKLLKEMS